MATTSMIAHDISLFIEDRGRVADCPNHKVTCVAKWRVRGGSIEAGMFKRIQNEGPHGKQGQ